MAAKQTISGFQSDDDITWDNYDLTIWGECKAAWLSWNLETFVNRRDRVHEETRGKKLKRRARATGFFLAEFDSSQKRSFLLKASSITMHRWWQVTIFDFISQ